VIKNPLFFSYFFVPNGKRLQRIGVEKKDVFLNMERGKKKTKEPRTEEFRGRLWIPARSMPE